MEAGELSGPGGDGDTAPTADEGEGGEPGDAGGDSSVPTADDGEAGEPGGPGGQTTVTSGDDGEAGEPGDAGGDSTTSTPEFFGAEGGHIWGPDCDVFVDELMEAGQYDELRSQLDACILNDPTAPADVVAAARDAKALAQERLAGGG